MILAAPISPRPVAKLPCFTSPAPRFFPKDKIESIVAQCSRSFNVPVEDIFSRRKTNQIALARQVAMYLVFVGTRLNYSAVARIFKRDHATVMHAIARVHDERSYNDRFHYVLTELESRFSIRNASKSPVEPEYFI